MSAENQKKSGCVERGGRCAVWVRVENQRPKTGARMREEMNPEVSQRHIVRREAAMKQQEVEPGEAENP